MQKFLIKVGVLGVCLALTGCASIVNGSNQVVSVETRLNGQPLAGATCQLVNPKGTFFVTTPGTVTIHRAYDDLSVKCEKAGVSTGILAVKSSTKAMAFGNAIFGGVIGAAVDVGTGAAYDYPSLITVNMDEAPTPVAPITAVAAPATGASN
ncbi:hypothetical protein [Pseudoduganella sp. GCM10020061]|uniref:hypothetical protein n=1 Tax=Pseudoduganella sp. GCM10020061 TaxID=3317345 RepID=UPI00363F4454